MEEEEEEIVRPRVVDTVQYVKDRIDQIAELLEVVDNSALKPGEVTSGPRTIFQRLPRHMRRRAMSHNVKRLPRMAREMAQRFATTKSSHRKKPPSRKWKRRPSRLLKKLQRLRRHNVWLETHIWHAKRFHMAELWGWKLPLRSFQRGFRPTYRNAFHSAVVFDLSYFCCLQILARNASSDLNVIIEILSKMCVNTVSPSFAFRPALQEGIEANALLYEPGRFPFGFIGPIRFSWAVDRKSNFWRLQIWSHPSSHSKVLHNIVRLTLAKLVKPKKLIAPNKDEDSASKKPKQISEKFKEEQISHIPSSYESSEFKVCDLRHELVRFRLIGPNIFPLLSKALHLVSDQELRELELYEHFCDSHKFWRHRLINKNFVLQAGNLRNGTTISLMVEDPRLFRESPNEKWRCEREECDVDPADESNVCPPSPALSLFWDEEFRNTQLEKRLTNADLEKARSEHMLGGLTSSPFKVAPANTAMDFWLALQFTNGRAAGLADKINLDFESGMLNFPADCADSAAAGEYAQIDATALRAKHMKRPHNRRLKYEGRLRVKYPFTFEWPELVSDWNVANSVKLSSHLPVAVEEMNGKKESKKITDYFVLRDKAILLKINEWFLGKKGKKSGKHHNINNAQAMKSIFGKYSNALIAVRLTQISRGRIKRLALICLPSEDDLRLLRADQKYVIEEPDPKNSEKIADIAFGCEHETAVEANSVTSKPKILEEFMTVTDSSSDIGGKILSLNELFPDEEVAKLKRRREKVKKRKDTIKRRKLDDGRAMDAATVVEDSNTAQNECGGDGNVTRISPESTAEKTLEITTYKESSSRAVVGRVVRGDYSFVESRGVSFGYCPLSVLHLIRRSNKMVLLRNSSSKFYHAANVSLNLSPSGEL